MRNLRLSKLSVLLAVLAVGCVDVAHAGSLIQVQLATLESVRLSVATGGLAYDPIHGLDRIVLDQKIEQAAREIVDAECLKLEPASSALLNIAVDQSRNPAAPEWAAIS